MTTTTARTIPMTDHSAAPATPPDLPRGMRIVDPAAIRRFRKHGIMGMGESFMDGQWTADRLDEVMTQVFTAPAPRLSAPAWGRMLAAVADKRVFNRQAARIFRIGEEHYDLGNDLFAIMLDKSMTYTSGYWANAATLDEAQEAKLDLLCRKLRLEPGMRVLDIGCGWGNFAHHAASRYGVHVTGITVSKEQAVFAQQRCAELDVDIRVQDYREVDERFDRVVSIEMIEAVGPKNMAPYYQTIDRCLPEGGLFALQAIAGTTLTRDSDRRLDQYILWLVKHIFPDGYLPRETQMVARHGTALHVLDWHRFADDYDRTLLAWADNFNAGWPKIAKKYGERFRRRWHFYLFGCAAAFRAQLVHVYQVVYGKGALAQRYTPVR